MKMVRLVFAALVFVGLTGPALAQDGLRSASLPERTPTNPIPPPRTDVFLAGPDTYRPHPVTPGQLPVFPGSAFWPSVYSGGSPPVVIINVLPEQLGLTRGSDAARRDAPVEEPPPVYTPGPPGRPKTFYVIPGCYAGDKMPQRQALPAGCDMRRMRTVRPG